MESQRHLPRLLGSEPDIKLNERDISDRIKSNFHEPLEKSQSCYQRKDNPSFLDIKKATSHPQENRLVRLNSSDVYEITCKGKIRAIHSNETIATAHAPNKRDRPKSGSYNSKRPWSNRSYRKQSSGSSLNNRPFSSNRKIFCSQNSHSMNGRRPSNTNRFTFHRSKIDDIIGQVDTYSKYETKVEKKMPRKYCHLRTQENIEANFGAYGKKAMPEKRQLRSSLHSNKSSERVLRQNSSGGRTQSIKIMKSCHPKTIGGVHVSLLTNLFNAKCKDLELRPKDGQLKRFYDFCNTAITGRKYMFREIGLGYYSAKVLGSILRLNN